MADRSPLVAGNWKLNGDRASATALATRIAAGAAGIEGARALVCPPFVHLADVQRALSGSRVALGAQDASAESGGAHTGEVAPAMLAEFGCTHAIVGHSERRADRGDTDARVAAKAVAVRRAGLVPILCIGETADERDADRADEVVGRQLDAALEALADAGEPIGDGALVVAYEPVWAIGTGRTATPDQAQAVHAAIRARAAARDAAAAATLSILYGGSMKPGNAAELLAEPDIDGGLIGGASLVAEDFLAILAAAARRPPTAA